MLRHRASLLRRKPVRPESEPSQGEHVLQLQGQSHHPSSNCTELQTAVAEGFLGC